MSAPAIMRWLVTTMRIELEPLTSREGVIASRRLDRR
jgi:hypothetical protein